MLKNIRFSDTDKTIGTTIFLFCIKMFLEVMSTRLRSLKKFRRRKLKKLQKKKENIEKPYLLTRCCHDNDFQKVNNNTEVIPKMLLIMLGEFQAHQSQGKSLGFLKHCSPI